jgi:hypoxanthine-DNA glycosylase
MPSEASSREGFYYGHPRNRFWRVIAAVFDEKVPETVEGKRELLLRNGVALWDVLASCEIEGSADASIKNPVPNDILGLVREHGIERVFANGGTAARLSKKYGIPAVFLPSTSAANAKPTLDELVSAWRLIARA